MAKYRIQRAKGVEGSTIYTYTAPGHNECVPTRLFDVDGGGANDIEGGKMIMGITYFVPGGGCDYGGNPLESIYYILTGEMTLKTEDGETVLHAGDAFHCAGGVAKSVTNTGTGYGRCGSSYFEWRYQYGESVSGRKSISGDKQYRYGCG